MKSIDKEKQVGVELMYCWIDQRAGQKSGSTF